MSSERSFWRTMPGAVTAVATLLGSMAAVLTAMYSVGWIGPIEPPREQTTGANPESTPSGIQAPATSPSNKEPVPLPTSACSEPSGSLLKYWDFDIPNCSPSEAKDSSDGFWVQGRGPRRSQQCVGCRRLQRREVCAKSSGRVPLAS